MKIGFIGDLHGRVFHALAAVVKWQQVNNEKLDLIIQVGDLGAYPHPDEEMLNNKFIKQDLTELDFSRLLIADGSLLEKIMEMKAELNSPIYFIRGNHEDFMWLDSLEKDKDGFGKADSMDLFKYIEDGTVINRNGVSIAFLGGIETENPEARSISADKYNALINAGNAIDILVTHDSLYGLGLNFKGVMQGSKLITALMEGIKPKFLITGHYHHMIGPDVYGQTIHIGLNTLVTPIRRNPERLLQPGSLAIMDTKSDTIEFVKNDWLTSINTKTLIDDF